MSNTTRYLVAFVVFLYNSPGVHTAQFAGQSVTQLDRSNIGTRLTGHVILGLDLGPNLHACGILCVTITQCLSINFVFQSGLCELNSVKRSMVNNTYMEANGSFIYADFATFAMTDYTCSSRLCSVTERCISMANGVHTCETLECPEPLFSLNGASISGGLRTIGSVRRYECPDGQRLVGNSQINCTGLELTWTTPSFTCEFVGDCTQLQLCNDNYTDGEYWLYPDAFNNEPVKIYCHNLTTADPGEYITVDPDVNHSYNRAQYPENNSRYNFTKIGISIGTNVSVIANDFSFILRSGPFISSLEYGIAMSCAWAWGAEGQFSINTTITGLIVDPSLEWKLMGVKSAFHGFVRSSDGDAISSNCGGHCGECRPKKEMTLHINPTHVMDHSKATVPSCKQA